MKIYYKNKSINISVKKLSSFNRLIGLMFKSKTNDNLLFEFNKDVKMSIHSYFVFFDFLAVWLDKSNNVIEFKIVRPFSFMVKSKKPSSKFIEVPINNKNKKIIDFFVGKGKI
ncbi:MAG: DUF192 domain-containing protein [Candidatus Pacearchaeota archaeon]|jgi:uncharacterized membrane protein (UPF0127 family)|nr:DUF192 domain-containing protein [Candidatus Pacearchaeota archaeon]|tara:strand:+ start:362 stop:700 length:339 start_codon:yes stop_codon:yes gene_type:complete